MISTKRLALMGTLGLLQMLITYNSVAYGQDKKNDKKESEREEVSRELESVDHANNAGISASILSLNALSGALGENITSAGNKAILNNDNSKSLSNTGLKVIYGDDNRFQVADYPDREIREFAKSVAGMVKNSKLSNQSEDLYSFRKTTALEALNLCESERFADEYTLPVCTGFLVAEDTLVTAGHCVSSEYDCANYSWVFDYTKGTEEIEKKNVYKCKKIVSQALRSSWFKLADFAVIQLDRKVEGREPLKLRQKGKPWPGTKLAVIGHPSGLPMKIADGAKVKTMGWKELLTPIRSKVRRKNYFTANLDTYAGNSGSPVFNLKKGIVEGILIQGARDFDRVDEEFCNRSHRRSNSAFVTEEKVFRITRVPGLTESGKKIKNKFSGAAKRTAKFVFDLRGEEANDDIFVENEKREPDSEDE